MNKIINICSPAGGGKTTITRELSARLNECLNIHFDDFDSYVSFPPISTWASCDPNEFKCQKLIEELEKLKNGQAITHPQTGETLFPTKIIVFDNALGRSHFGFSEVIDYSIFLDSPLDICLARRILRDYFCPNNVHSTDELQDHLNAYLKTTRNAFVKTQQTAGNQADFIVNGLESVPNIVETIFRELKIHRYI